MIVLDTNVISEVAKPTPNPAVVAWVDAQIDPAIAAPSVGELRFGVARLPEGRRQAALSQAVDEFLADDLDGLVLAFDVTSADAYGLIVAARERSGRPIGIADAQIAAICSVHGAALATRNVRDFRDTGIEIVDPWNPPDAARWPTTAPPHALGTAAQQTREELASPAQVGAAAGGVQLG